MIPVPEYLKEYAVNAKETRSKQKISFSLRCPCGCERFAVCKNYFTKQERDEEKPYYDLLGEMYGKDRDLYKWVKGEDGVAKEYKKVSRNEDIWEEFIMPDMPYFSLVLSIKARCADCGREFFLFDNRFHGYDGVMCEEKSPERMAYQPHYRAYGNKVKALSVTVENDPSLEEFIEDCGEVSEETYSNSFSWITIRGTDDEGRKSSILSWETA